MQDLACLAALALQPEDLAELVRCGLTSALSLNTTGQARTGTPKGVGGIGYSKPRSEHFYLVWTTAGAAFKLGATTTNYPC
jgi:hypothetical protein